MERRQSSNGGLAHRDGQLSITESMEPVGLRFAGVVDASNLDAVRQVVDRTLRRYPDTDLHIDLAGLEFADTDGIKAFVSAAKVDDTRRLVLHGLPPLVSRVMDVVGWSDLPALNISDAPFPEL